MTEATITDVSAVTEVWQNASQNYTVESSVAVNRRDISDIVRICFSIILCIVMFGVGCAGDFRSIFTHFRRPAGICTGIFNQVIIMPLLALLFVYATQLPAVEQMAVLIQGTSPGGMMSNIITVWIQGDVNLSISMTAVSTVIALGSMPLWLFLFTKLLNIDEDLQIPFSQLGIALAIMVVPVILGTILRRYKPKIAGIITKIFTIFGTIAIVITLIVSGVVSELSFIISWKQCLIACLTPIFGMTIGYLISWLKFLKLSEQSRRTVAIETGMQNCQISQSVLVISYASNILVYEQIRLFPLVNSGFQILWGLLVMGVARWCLKSTEKYSPATSVAVEKADDALETEDNELEERQKFSGIS